MDGKTINKKNVTRLITDNKEWKIKIKQKGQNTWMTAQKMRKGQGQRTEDGKCKNTKRTYIPGKKYTDALAGINEEGEWQMERREEQKTEMPQWK